MINPHHITQACRRTQDALLIATEKPSPKPQNGGGGGASIEPPMPLPVSLISAKRELADWLVDWCSLVRDGLEVVATYDLDEHSRLEWLGTGERAEYLAGHDAGLDFLDEITVLTRQLESPYLPRAGKKYIGNYGGGAVYIREGQQTVELADGETHNVTDLKAYNAAHMLDMEGTASDVANIIKAFFGHDITPKQIANTRDKDQRRSNDDGLKSLRKEGNAHIYRVWDVLNRMC